MPFLLKNFFNFLVHSNSWVGLTAACFSLIASDFFQAPSPFFIILFSTQFLYSFQRLFKYRVLKVYLGPERERWYERNERFMWVWMFVNGLLALWLLFGKIEVLSNNIWSIVFFGSISLFYVIPFRKGLNLRNVPLAKGFLVTLVYAWFTLWLFYSQINRDDTPWFLLYGSLYVLAATLMFDWRDRRLDDEKIRTIPQLIGRKASLVLVSLLYIISLVGMFRLGLFKREVCFALVLLHNLGIVIIYRRENALIVSLVFEGLMALVGLAAYSF
ncbi:MAG: hypothetical protein N4A41_11020 [Crocinitomicaceae bacterium]|jgi:hypothetical protein|nr:hypothetical protein [Crocinitomicaceae bacterium]